MALNNFIGASLTEAENLINQANSQLKQGNDGDDVYHPLYLAWRSVQKNPLQLNSIRNFETFGMGFFIFLSYGTVSDIDDKQQLASLAYLYISMAIEQNPSNLNNYKNRLLVMLGNHEAFSYTVSSVVNKGGNLFSMNFMAFDARDAMFKMEYSDLSKSPVLLQIDMFAAKKRDLDNKISDGFFGTNKTIESIILQGQKHHNEVLHYLKKKVLQDQDLDF